MDGADDPNAQHYDDGAADDQDQQFEDDGQNEGQEDQEDKDGDDEYFDDAAEIGYLPAEHVTWIDCLTFFIATHGPCATSFDRLVDQRARKSRFGTQRKGKNCSIYGCGTTW